jgi:hypothetical protein
MKAKPRVKRGSIKLRKGNLCDNPKAKGLSIRGISLGKIRETAAAGHKAGRRVNRLPEWADKRSYINKGQRHRLFGADYQRLRWEAYVRAHGRCECGCGRYAYWYTDLAPTLESIGDVAHNEHGARKSDELDRVKWKRRECHEREHNPKPINVTKKSLKENAA